MNAIILNPKNPAPDEIVDSITTVSVRYVGFDGKNHSGTIEIHKALASDVDDFFALAFTLRFPIERIVLSSDPEFAWDDDKLMAGNTTSGFNYRLIKGTDKPSLHGLGRAFDINCRINPYVRYVSGSRYVDPPGAVYEPGAAGALSVEHPLVQLLKSRGWVWGGDWTAENHGATDYQHFQKAEII